MTSRIVAVADTWSALTAGGPRLSHADALVELANAAGTRFDPRVVQAAYQVVAEERVSAIEPAPEPRLHQLRLPAPPAASSRRPDDPSTSRAVRSQLNWRGSLEPERAEALAGALVADELGQRVA